LKKLQDELEHYIRESSFHYFKMATTTEVDDAAFTVQTLTGTQSDALRADFLAYNQRTADAESLLDQVLKEEPNNVSAQETKGFLEFRQGHMEEARKWYAKAVQLDSRSYLAHYYFAAIAMTAGELEQEQVENSLRAAIKLNPQFAPAFDRLAVLLAMRHKNLDEARMMGLTAISLEPANIGYRINIANIFMTMEKGQRAVEVLRNAAKLAKTPQDSAMVNAALMNAEQYVEAQARFAEQDRRMNEEEKADGAASASAQGGDQLVPHFAHRSEFIARGPHRFLVGVLKGVRCNNPALDLSVDSNGKLVVLHVDNYFKISFTSLGFKADKDLNPCSDLENRPAKVEFVESANPSVTAQLISVELHK
jgi:predicted Zn-dependent protease